MSNISYVYGTESDKYNAYTIYRDGRRLEPEPLAEYIEKLESRIAELEAKQRWIPVSERLPEEFTLVLTIGKDNLPVAAHVDGKNWYSSFEYSLNVTHWMTLPEPPEESEK